MIPHHGTASPPLGPWELWLDIREPVRGWGSLGAPCPGPRMGDAMRLGLQGERPAKKGQPCSIVAGFGIVEWGTAPVPPWRGAWLDVRVWGCAEGGEERGKGRGRTCRRCPGAAALQGCREGSGGVIGVPGQGHWAVHWWAWGCFTPHVPGRPWCPSCAAISACKENNPPGRVAAPPTPCWVPIDVGDLWICGHQRVCTGASGRAYEIPGHLGLSWLSGGSAGPSLVVHGMCGAGWGARSAPCSWHRRAEDRPLLSARRGVSPRRE